jgi:hypothetical protein
VLGAPGFAMRRFGLPILPLVEQDPHQSRL